MNEDYLANRFSTNCLHIFTIFSLVLNNTIIIDHNQWRLNNNSNSLPDNNASSVCLEMFENLLGFSFHSFRCESKVLRY